MKTRKKLGENNIRKIGKMGRESSYYITLPIDVIRRWGWRGRQKVELVIDEKNKTIKIKDWEK